MRVLYSIDGILKGRMESISQTNSGQCIIMLLPNDHEIIAQTAFCIAIVSMTLYSVLGRGQTCVK